MGWIEWLAAGLGILNVWLVIRRSIWNFPVAIVMCALYLWIFFDARLYSDSLLQLFFIAINIYGLAAWIARKKAEGEIRVERLGQRARLGVFLAVLVATALWGSVVALNTDASHPYWDALIAMSSIGSQILLAQRKLENWIGWIFVNLISVPLYAIKGLYPTTLLYSVLLIMAVAGLIEWQRKAMAEDNPA